MWLWIAVRLLASALLFMGGSDLMRLSIEQIVLLVSVTAVLALVDIGIRKERALIGNLGVSRAIIVLISIAPVIAGETVIALIGRM